MPLNYNYDGQYNSNLLGTFNETTQIIRHSTNKNDAIRTLSNVKIKGSSTKIGNKTAHDLYNKYQEYTGHSNRRYC